MGVRIGVVGLGRIGAFHVDTLASSDAVDRVLVTDVVPEAIESVTGRYCQAQGCADVDAVLAAGVDGLVIASATATRAGFIEKSVAAGVPVFCEKPIAMSSTETAGVVARCAGSGVPVVIGCSRRSDPAVSAVCDAVASGALGFITTARSVTLDPVPPPMSYIARSGGIFRDLAVHDFDTLRWVVGQDVVEVYATGANLGDPEFTAYDDIDSATAILTFDSGAMGVVSVGRYNGRGHDRRLEVHGSADSVVADWNPDCTFPEGAPHGSVPDRLADARRRELHAFCAMVAGASSTSLCTLDEALETALIADAATTSMHEKRPVRIDEIAEIPSSD
ncbi:Gfo/Idh/MocA family oxidoreductase [Gordonia sp. (in: high G+C Gram-positive bacteria)]|jgi:myo-inositol 2-dehydrogenase/D-chiro-inositol 1-dehydrogenase|uniref:Gfo/Idh/MocA family protein n=1 Tax=Gordonia sp. (in: high G+C Gram-positive bacteria) TaxID=84139 RepID=UPI002630E8C7|nr:Gfo/Idh/MocA family oxidoreductase [Gordonia sp. (in: high G+C Gram-positive bacteria)]HMS76146.1 Gfo/Idh/MocA family oxidoreductase [Gordonia sp. (in: high G+C Gram-positive bacteria)]